MKNSSAVSYIRRTISVSPEVDGTIANYAEREFSGNVSAFIAHCVIQYLTCRACRKVEFERGKDGCEEEAEKSA